VLWQRLKDEVEKEQELVNSLQNMVVVVDENSDNSSDDGNLPQLLHSLVSETNSAQFMWQNVCRIWQWKSFNLEKFQICVMHKVASELKACSGRDGAECS